MSDFTELREDFAGLAKALDSYSATTVRNLLEQSRQIDKLWTDNAELRDELHGVANRLENLTRAVTTDPAEVAAAIVNDANRQTLREVREEET
jgi:cytochrome c556